MFAGYIDFKYHPTNTDAIEKRFVATRIAEYVSNFNGLHFYIIGVKKAIIFLVYVYIDPVQKNMIFFWKQIKREIFLRPQLHLFDKHI